MARDAESASTALRSALQGPFPTLRAEALRLIARALEQPTFEAAAEELGMAGRMLRKIRTEVPEAFREVPGRSKKRSR